MEYRHQCHVGDHRDALKHPVLVLVKSLMQQHSRLNVIDTHSGTGCYDYTTAPSNREGEFAERGLGTYGEIRLTCQSHFLLLCRCWNTTT